MKKIVFMMIGAALVSLSCNPGTKKSSNSKAEAAKQDSSVLKHNTTIHGDSASSLATIQAPPPASSLAGKRAPDRDNFTAEDKALWEEYQQLHGVYLGSFDPINLNIQLFNKTREELNTIPKDDPTRKDERITLQRKLQAVLKRIHDGNAGRMLAAKNINTTRLVELHQYFTGESDVVRDLNKYLITLPKTVEVEEEN